MPALASRRPDLATLAAGRHRFRNAEAVTPSQLLGDWEFVPTGPEVIRKRWHRALRLLQAGSVEGIRFAEGTGVLMERSGRRRHVPSCRSIRVVAESSVIDGRPCVAVEFPDRDRFPWPWLRLEVRALTHDRTWPVDGRWAIGLLLLDLPGRFPIPLLLQWQPKGLE